MNDPASKALLPAGLSDLLPPDAEHEAAIARRLLDCFGRYGYERVKPPLVEFEEGLLESVGAGTADQTFRVMDPASHRMMGLRADITPQVARIADTRLARAPRPLRLSYSGDVLRIKGTQLRPGRQILQTGIELIGAAKAAAGDAEAIVLAAEAVSAVGVSRLTIDLHLPPLAQAVCDACNLDAAQYRGVRAALDRKDAGALREAGGEAAPVLGALLEIVGPAREGIAAMARIDLPPAAAALRERLAEVVDLVFEAAPDLHLTVDPIERRGFEYHTGVSFTLFALGAREEIGAGGRYLTGAGEPATGFTLYMDTLLEVAPAPVPEPRLFVPRGTPPERSKALRDEGWITVNGLIAAADDYAEARRMRCSHVYVAGAVRPLAD